MSRTEILFTSFTCRLTDGTFSEDSIRTIVWSRKILINGPMLETQNQTNKYRNEYINLQLNMKTSVWERFCQHL